MIKYLMDKISTYSKGDIGMINKKMHKLFSMLLNISNNLKDGGKYFYDYKIM